MFLVLVCACAWARVSAAADAPVVHTTLGRVQGALLHDHGVSYYAYQGIPYAENPTGDLRFKPPVPKKPWKGVFDGRKPGPACPQPTGRIAREAMSEDCLRLNVFVPANTTRRHLPVLVFFHGGSYKANSGNIDFMFGPQMLLQRGIIHVSLNFRLGALGYLSFGSEEASGNAGLKDVILALKWVKRNIHRFGGSTITIGGQSSGSAMVHHMLLTDKSKGLFDRALLSSGSASNYRFLSRYPRTLALALANELDFTGDRDEIILQNLRKVNVFDIVEAQEKLYKDNRNIMRPAFAPFVPCIEKESEHSVLTRHPIEIVKEGIPQNVPILAGINSREGGFMWPTLNKKQEATLQEQFPLSIPADLEYPHDSDMYKNLVNSISEFYFGKNLSNWTLPNFYDYISDTQYTYSVCSWIKIHKERKSSNSLYYYMFDFDGELNWAKVSYNISFPGAAHTDEIGYWFVNEATDSKLANPDEDSRKTINNMLTYMYNFIKTGSPNPAAAPWPEHGGAGRHLRLGPRAAAAAAEPFPRRTAFWTQVYRQYREYLENGGLVTPIYN